MSFLAVLFIFIASLVYVIASYAVPIYSGLSVWKSILLAMPLVFIEYNFSIRGNRRAHEDGYKPLQILTLTIVFYYIAMFIMEKLLSPKKYNITEGIKDVTSAALIALGFYIGLVR